MKMMTTEKNWLGLVEGRISSDTQVRTFQVHIMIPSRTNWSLSYPEAVTYVEVLYRCWHDFFQQYFHIE